MTTSDPDRTPELDDIIISTDHAPVAANDTARPEDALAAKVEDFAPKTISDGLSIDAEDTIYVSDPEHGAVLALGRDRKLRTLLTAFSIDECASFEQ